MITHLNQTKDSSNFFEPFHQTPKNNIGIILHGSGNFSLQLVHSFTSTCAYNKKALLVQPRGNHRAQLLCKNQGKFKIETVTPNGTTKEITSFLGAVGSIQDDKDLEAYFSYAHQPIDFIFLGLTEAGISASNRAFLIFGEFLLRYYAYHAPLNKKQSLNQIRIIGTDNINNNKQVITEELKKVFASLQNDSEQTTENKRVLENWLEEIVLDTMVDRIVTRGSSPLTIRAEPEPSLVLSLQGKTTPNLENIVLHINSFKIKDKTHIWIDRQLKLRIANAIHTAMVYPAAIMGYKYTFQSIKDPLIKNFTDNLFEKDIYPGLTKDLGNLITQEEIRNYYEQWINRLQNENIKHHNVVIAQNGFEKIQMRLLPTIKAQNFESSHAMHFAVACILKYFTPKNSNGKTDKNETLFIGKFDKDHLIYKYRNDELKVHGNTFEFTSSQERKLTKLLNFSDTKEETQALIYNILFPILNINPIVISTNQKEFLEKVFAIYWNLSKRNSSSSLEDFLFKL